MKKSTRSLTKCVTKRLLCIANLCILIDTEKPSSVIFNNISHIATDTSLAMRDKSTWHVLCDTCHVSIQHLTVDSNESARCEELTSVVIRPSQCPYHKVNIHLIFTRLKNLVVSSQKGSKVSLLSKYCANKNIKHSIVRTSMSRVYLVTSLCPSPGLQCLVIAAVISDQTKLWVGQTPHKLQRHAFKM